MYVQEDEFSVHVMTQTEGQHILLHTALLTKTYVNHPFMLLLTLAFHAAGPGFKPRPMWALCEHLFLHPFLPPFFHTFLTAAPSGLGLMYPTAYTCRPAQNLESTCSSHSFNIFRNLAIKNIITTYLE